MVNCWPSPSNWYTLSSASRLSSLMLNPSPSSIFLSLSCLSLTPSQRSQTRCTTYTMATPAARSSRWPTTHWWRSLLHCYTESSTTTIPTMRSLETLCGVVRMSWAPGEMIWIDTEFLSCRLRECLKCFPLLQLVVKGFLCVTVVFLSINFLFPKSATIYMSLLVSSFDDVLFRINYSQLEVSYITKAKAVWTGAARSTLFSHSSWHCLHPL